MYITELDKEYWRVNMVEESEVKEVLQKYEKLYDELKNITLRDTMILTTRSDREDVQDFYQAVENYFIVKRQKETVNKKIY